MNAAITNQQPRQVAEPIKPEVLEAVILGGDLARLTAPQRVEYMLGVCRTIGLNPATKPFEFITLNGKLVMYARRDCTDQLRKIHGVSITIKSREVINGVYVVTANAQDSSGRLDESTGAVGIDGLKGETLANAMMKAETKAKRRVTLSICGLGLLDETEVDSVKSVEADHGPRQKVATVTGEVKERKPEWPKEALEEATALRNAINKYPGGDEKVMKTYRAMKYDHPQDVVDALGAILREYQDVAADIESEPVAIIGTDKEVNS